MAKKTAPTKGNRSGAKSAGSKPEPKPIKNNLTDKAVVSSAAEKSAIAADLAADLEQEVNGIVVGALAWSIDVALAMLRLMQGEGVQRPVQWAHAANLAKSMRAACLPSGVDVRWFDGTTIGVIASDSHGIDSRHRNIAYVLAFGRAEDLDTLMRVVECHPIDRPDNLDPAEYLVPPVRGWVVNWSTDDTGKCDVALEAPGWCFPVSIGVQRDAFAVLDADAKKRTGADTLVTDANASKLLAESGIDAKVMQQVLRAMWLRTLQSIDKTTEELRPGSLRRGGNINNNRYRLFAELFGDWVLKANEAIETAFVAGQEASESSPGYDYDATRLDSLGYPAVLAVAALHYAEYQNAEEIGGWIDTLCANPDPKTPAAYLVNYITSKELDGKSKKNVFKVGRGKDQTFATLHSAELFTGLVLSITQPDLQLTQAEFIKHCQDEYATRIEGIDTDGLDDDLVTKTEQAVFGTKGKSSSSKKRSRVKKRTAAAAA